MPSYNYRSKQRPTFNNNRQRSGSRYGSQQNRRRGAQYIDASRFVRVAKPVTLEEYVAQNKFADFDVEQLLKTNIISKGLLHLHLYRIKPYP